MAGFADELGLALQGSLARAQAPPPPPPTGTFADGLAAFFGGGPDINAAYNTGIESRTKASNVSAQTLEALAQAEERRQNGMRTAAQNDLAMKMRAAPDYQPGGYADLLTFATGANDLSNGQLNQQELGRRDVLNDPLASPDAQFRAGQSIQGRMLPRVETLGAGRELDMLTGKPYTNDIGQAQIQNYREQPATSGAGVPGKPLVRSSPVGPVQSTDGGVTWNPVLDNSDVAAYNAARTAGGATGQKQAALYANLNNIDTFTGDVDALLQHPGFAEIYGMSSVLDPRNLIRGTDAQGAAALRDKLNSRAFLVSIQSMRGMGQLSNQEGAKVETALTAALKPGLGDMEATQRLGELKTAIANLRRVAEQEASATENALTPAGPVIGMVEDGYRYLGGDPAAPTSWQKVQ
jgi:hypothetical protein